MLKFSKLLRVNIDKGKNEKGLTLIELLIVIALVAIVAAIALPILLNVLSGAKTSAAADSTNGVAKFIQDWSSAGYNVNYVDPTDPTFGSKFGGDMVAYTDADGNGVLSSGDSVIAQISGGNATFNTLPGTDTSGTVGLASSGGSSGGNGSNAALAPTPALGSITYQQAGSAANLYNLGTNTCNAVCNGETDQFTTTQMTNLPILTTYTNFTANPYTQYNLPATNVQVIKTDGTVVNLSTATFTAYVGAPNGSAPYYVDFVQLNDVAIPAGSVPTSWSSWDGAELVFQVNGAWQSINFASTFS